MAEKSVAEDYFASKMFFSSKGVASQVGILDSNEQECGIKKEMMKNSQERFYLCDSSKLGKVGFVKLCGFEDISYFVTESKPEADLVSKLEENEVKLICD